MAEEKPKLVLRRELKPAQGHKPDLEGSAEFKIPVALYMVKPGAPFMENGCLFTRGLHEPARRGDRYQVFVKNTTDVYTDQEGRPLTSAQVLGSTPAGTRGNPAWANGGVAQGLVPYRVGDVMNITHDTLRFHLATSGAGSVPLGRSRSYLTTLGRLALGDTFEVNNVVFTKTDYFDVDEVRDTEVYVDAATFMRINER